MGLPTLPATLTVGVLGEDLTMAARPNKAGTNVWYKGSKLVELSLDIEAVKKVLAAVTATFLGNTLKAGEVHISAPRKYGRTHEKAGQVVPGSGGNWTVTHSAVIDLADNDGGKHPFTLMATVTYIAEAKRPRDKVGFAVTIQAIPQPARVPTLQGGEGLADVLAQLVSA